MIGEYNNIRICGMSVAVPETVSDIQLYEKVLGERRVRKQAKLTGVHRAHISPSGQRESDLCYAAAKRLIDDLKWEPQNIDVMVFASQCPNYRLPSTAFFLQKRLGIGEECLVYDINLGCSSFNVGSQDVMAHLSHMKEGAKGLLLTGDACSEITSEAELIPESLKNYMLFGSAGAAIAFEKQEGNKVHYLIRSKGEAYKSIMGHFGRPTEMIGNAVFDFAINDVSRDIQCFCDEILTNEEPDFYALHQAQKMIVDSIVDTCKIQEDKVLNSYEEFGNTSGASIPLNICSNIDKLKKNSSNSILMCGFGVGLSWAIMYAKIPTEHILPVIYTDEQYNEDKMAGGSLWNKRLLFWGVEEDVCISALEWICGGSSHDLNFGSMGGAAAVYAVGSNIERATDVCNRSVFPAFAVESTDYSTISDYIRQNNDMIDGVVISCRKMTDVDIPGLVENLSKNDCLSGRGVKVVLLDDNKSSVPSEERLRRLYDEMRDIQNITVNMIVVDEDTISYHPFMKHEREWMRDYLEGDDGDKMSRAREIASYVRWLVSDSNHFLNCSVLYLDGRKEVYAC